MKCIWCLSPVARKGCTVIRYTAPWKMMFFADSFGIRSLQTPARKLLELLFDYKIEKKPLLFHVFSNGGVMLYRYILELIHMHGQFSSLKVVGTIFDSAPGRRNMTGSLRALAAVLGSTNVLLKYCLLLVFAILVVVLRILLYPVTRFFHETHYDTLLKGPSRWPELYLYSKGDRIILASDIEHMIEARRQHNVAVRAVDFSDSAHVSHLPAYPSYYMSLCTSFMYDCAGCS
ncbi:transmembrane protein 53 isoform X2 [Dermochelys coriacea]|uniref:transmembrane protein 53 isoform X2 n=1 Tax=Dermochelys coriacea TaxID=27794 RepID=UPI001CA91E7A|nr:transmembrane protein 53 isoform X2 [Dermochelys coriacea]